MTGKYYLHKEVIINYIYYLEDYKRLELEKKKNRIQKQINKGPMIKYQSFTMPLIEELPMETEINVDDM